MSERIQNWRRQARRQLPLMKTNDPNDDKLSGVLRSWKVAEPLPPRFQERVWARIETLAEQGTNAWFVDFNTLLQRLFPRPAMAYAYVIILLVAGLTGGYLKAQQQESRIESQLAARYVQSVDPYQKEVH